MPVRGCETYTGVAENLELGILWCEKQMNHTCLEIFIFLCEFFAFLSAENLGK